MMSYAVAGEIQLTDVIELAQDEFEEIADDVEEFVDFEEIDETKVRVRWTGSVRVLREFGTIRLRGRELSRTTIIVEGAGIVAGSALTIELELGGERFQALVQVDTTIHVDGVAISLLRIGATSPRGNDLIATQVKRGCLTYRARTCSAAA